MTIVNFKSFINSVRYAASGIKYAFIHEQNFRIQVSIGAVICVLMGAFNFHARDVLFIILIISFILILELINTVLERFITLLEPKLQGYAKVIKDVMAGAVLLASLLAIISGIIIFWPYIQGLT